MTDPRDPIKSAFEKEADEALDRLLAAAEWPALPAGATPRLRETLHAQRQRPLRVAWWTTLAAAAAVLLAVAGWRFHRVEPAVTLTSLPSAETPSAPILAGKSPGESAPKERPATAYERLLLAAPVPRQGPRSIPSITSTPATSPTPTELAAADRNAAWRVLTPGAPGVKDDAALVTRLGGLAAARDWPLVRAALLHPRLGASAAAALVGRRDPVGVDLLLTAVLDADARPPVAAAIRRHRSLPTDALLARLTDPLVERRLAAAMALGASCDPAVLARLADMARSGDRRREALAALIACESPLARQLLSGLDRDPLIARQTGAMRGEMKSLFL